MSKFLTGEEIVAKGAIKNETSLPELGLKDVTSNGSWLEQKQIQSAIDARKQLIGVERIEKGGVLSYAIWDDKLALAEVTQKCGGFWQYMGHSVGGKIYLYPEEALYLIETNCLKLTFNEVTVSVQQAYALLLQEPGASSKYKVYASLTRIGYRLLRHVKEIEPTEYEKKLCLAPYKLDKIKRNKHVDTDENTNEEMLANIGKSNEETVVSDPINEGTSRGENSEELIDDVGVSVEPAEGHIVDGQANGGFSENKTESDNGTIKESPENAIKNIDAEANASNSSPSKSWKDIIIDRLLRRSHMHTSRNKHMDAIPKMFRKTVVTLAAPAQCHLPAAVAPLHSVYQIDLERLKRRAASPAPARVRYLSTDDVSDGTVPRLRSVLDSPMPNNWNAHFQRPVYHNNYWHFPNQRPRSYNNFNFLYGFMFQRPFMHNVFVPPRFNLIPRAPGPEPAHSRKRTRESSRTNHLASIKNLVDKLKIIIMNGNNNLSNIQSLQNLINSYNIRYKSRMRLTNNFELDEGEVETITLEDDDEPRRKALRENHRNYDENLERIKQLAHKLKCIEEQKPNTRLRRAFSNMIKKFNASYSADVYVNENQEVVDRLHITIDSSESDCVIEEPEQALKPGKKLRNPFSVLRRRSKSSISAKSASGSGTTHSSKYVEISKIFKGWLPNEGNFGCPELPCEPRSGDFVQTTRSEEYIYEFVKQFGGGFKNWVDLKLSFWESIDDSPVEILDDSVSDNEVSRSALVKPEDCTNIATVLEKLRVIGTCSDAGTKPEIDFDVYYRDVQNFRKSDLPTPHFRLLCIDQTSTIPSGAAVQALDASPGDGAPLVLAVTGAGAASFLRMTPLDVPVYLPNYDMSV